MSHVRSRSRRILGDDAIADAKTILLAFSYRQHDAHGDGQLLRIAAEKHPVHPRPGEIG